jgi:hypothetical protein
MRFAFIPWVALSVASVASGEPIETITRDISLAAHAQAQSLHSLFATEQPPDQSPGTQR